MRKNLFEKALKIAELTKPKEREIRAIEFCYKDENVVTFRITFDIETGNDFYVKIYNLYLKKGEKDGKIKKTGRNKKVGKNW